MNNLVKALIALVVVLLGCAGLLMSLCGGIFTVSALTSPSLYNNSVVVPLGSLAVGFLLMWGAYTFFRQAMKNKERDTQTARSSSDSDGSGNGSSDDSAIKTPKTQKDPRESDN